MRPSLAASLAPLLPALDSRASAAAAESNFTALPTITQETTPSDTIGELCPLTHIYSDWEIRKVGTFPTRPQSIWPVNANVTAFSCGGHW